MIAVIPVVLLMTIIRHAAVTGIVTVDTVIVILSGTVLSVNVVILIVLGHQTAMFAVVMGSVIVDGVSARNTLLERRVKLALKQLLQETVLFTCQT